MLSTVHFVTRKHIDELTEALVGVVDEESGKFVCRKVHIMSLLAGLMIQRGEGSTIVGTQGYIALAQNKSMHESIRKRALAKAARESKKSN